MKGRFGVPMNGIERMPVKKGVRCKNCIHLKYEGGAVPYICTIDKTKNNKRYYTSIVKCKKFRKAKRKSHQQGRQFL